MNATALCNLAVQFRALDPNLGHVSVLDQMNAAGLGYPYGLFRSIPKRHKRRRQAMADSIAGQLEKKAGFDGHKRPGNCAIPGIGTNSPAMMEARAAFAERAVKAIQLAHEAADRVSAHVSVFNRPDARDRIIDIVLWAIERGQK